LTTLPQRIVRRPDLEPVVSDMPIVDEIFVKVMAFPKAGAIVPQHAHVYDHISLIAAGSVRAWKDGAFFGEFMAPCGVTIEARAKHTFETLADGTVIACIHNVRSAEGAIEIAEEHQLNFVEET
jgi:hypothetical protein